MSQTVGDAVVAAPKMVRKVSMAVLTAQQKWLMDNVEMMLTPRTPEGPAKNGDGGRIRGEAFGG